jgi:predicted DNA-binding transcriptional regulator AlpA
MAAAYGVSRQSLYLWQRDRAATGHPDPAGKIGGTTYWYEDEWAAWYQSHQQGKRDGLTRVDREGDPDDLVDATETARIMGYSSRAVIHGNVRLGYFPQPDSHKAARMTGLPSVHRPASSAPHPSTHWSRRSESASAMPGTRSLATAV